MSVFLYTLIALYALSIVINIATVGKPRRPMTPGLAAATTVINAGIIIGLILVVRAL